MIKKTWKLFLFLSIVCVQFPLLAEEIINEQQVEDNIAKIREQSNGDPASYPLVIEYKDEVTGEIKKKTIYFTIEGDNTKTNGDEVINANNASISPLEVFDMNATDWLKLTDAKAWNKKNNERIPIVTIDATAVQAVEGSYQVSFATANGTMTSATITVTLNTGNKTSILNIYTELIQTSFFEKMLAIIIFNIWLIILVLPLCLLLIQYHKIRKFTFNVYKLIKERQ